MIVTVYLTLAEEALTYSSLMWQRSWNAATEFRGWMPEEGREFKGRSVERRGQAVVCIAFSNTLSNWAQNDP